MNQEEPRRTCLGFIANTDLHTHWFECLGASHAEDDIKQPPSHINCWALLEHFHPTNVEMEDTETESLSCQEIRKLCHPEMTTFLDVEFLGQGISHY